MKTTMTIFLALIGISGNVYCQPPLNVCQFCNNTFHQFDFNSPYDSTIFYFYFDTLQLNNIWEIGKPEKTIFTTGFSGPRALVTDTINPYPVNNLSSFQFSMKNCSSNNACVTGWQYTGIFLYLATKINSDSLLDGGTIEVSHHGLPFINIIEDPQAWCSTGIYSINDTVASLHKPGYSGTSSDWQQLNICFYSVPYGGQYDTIILKFTFSSDSIQTNKDGWMVGIIQVDGTWEGINSVYKNNLVTVSPNPCLNNLHVKYFGNQPNGVISIFSSQGKGLKTLFSKSNNEIIDMSDLKAGIYFLNYSTDKEIIYKKIIKIN